MSFRDERTPQEVVPVVDVMRGFKEIRKALDESRHEYRGGLASIRRAMAVRTWIMAVTAVVAAAIVGTSLVVSILAAQGVKHLGQRVERIEHTLFRSVRVPEARHEEALP